MTGSKLKRTAQKEPKALMEERRRRKFAKSLTRNLFGPHYWDDALEAEKQIASQKKK